MLRLFATILVLLAVGNCANAEGLKVSPPAVVLDSPEASQQLLVSVEDATGRLIDRTRVARYQFAERIATIDERGLIRPLAEGKTDIRVDVGDQSITIPVDVRGLKSPVPVSFREEIIPILTKFRCNSGGCHGKAEGQAGFKLSIFGFDTAADYRAIVQESHGRRVSTVLPKESLLYLKGSSRIPHGGGRKIEPGSYPDLRLLRWLKEGAPFETPEDETGRITSIQIEPTEQVLLAGETQQIRVIAIDTLGRERDVTVEAEFESNAESIASVDEIGLIQASDIPGEAAILVRYLGHVAVCRITMPRPGITFERPPEHNFIDPLVWDKLQRLGIRPSGPVDDAGYLRRVYLDVIGTLPTAEEVRTFLADKSPDKRARVVDRIFERPEYADYWTMKWLDILRADQLAITPQSTVAMQRWLHKHFAQNRPFDELARELLTVQGHTAAEGPAGFYKVASKPDEAARSISQLLLGVRIECAQCHHHPSERWSQADYTGFAGFFTGVKLKTLPDKQQAVVSFGGNDLPHPRSGELVPARALGAPTADFSSTSDRRTVLADWMTSPENPFFAKAIANRLWAHYFGRGLVEPIDDIRDTNPATNEPLMQALAQHMIDVKFDLQAFTRTLLTSYAYQMSSATNDSNKDDHQNFSHAAYKVLPAEVLLDAICQSTGVPEEFNGWPAGYRAIQIWDNRMPSYFFTIFGRPVRATVCECERSDQPSISQALHLLNSPEITDKIRSRFGRARDLAASDLTPTQIIDELYLTTLSRVPNEQERALMLQAFSGTDAANRRAAVEDVLWALLNSKEFVFNH